uniref:Uncharacterized protein n=1 Tax=Magallana gigas TaxID=29159 RepID=A0A8W8LPM9_MAGGI
MVMLIFMIFVADTCATQCQEGGYNNCCEDYEWDEILGNCTRCKPGIYGINCNRTCTYPHFGYGCQQICNCSKEVCDFAKGCSKDDTTNEVYAKDVVRDYRATPFNISFSITMDNIGNPTIDIERPRDKYHARNRSDSIPHNVMSVTSDTQLSDNCQLPGQSLSIGINISFPILSSLTDIWKYRMCFP